MHLPSSEVGQFFYGFRHFDRQIALYSSDLLLHVIMHPLGV